MKQRRRLIPIKMLSKVLRMVFVSPNCYKTKDERHLRFQQRIQLKNLTYRIKNDRASSGQGNKTICGRHGIKELFVISISKVLLYVKH